MEELQVSTYRNNNGVTCYMNSILSILQQTPLLVDYIIQINDLDEDTIIYNLHKLFNATLSNTIKSVNPISLRTKCADKYFIWGENEQQDSSEFLTFIISNIQEELGKTVTFIPGREIIDEDEINNPLINITSVYYQQLFTKKEYSPIIKMFSGLSKNHVTCSICNIQSINFTPFILLDLTVPNNNTTLIDCLDNWIHPEDLDDHNRYECSFCGIKCNCSKGQKIWNPPKILVIHLKRFKKDMYGAIYSKNTSMVEYPINDLNISNYIDDDSPHKHKNEYNLFAVNIHHGLGKTLNFGHYISFVKNRSDDKWYVFNDDHRIQRIRTKDDLIDNNAYLLFYLRKN